MAGTTAGIASLHVPRATTLPCVISTWSFGKKANAEAWKILTKGGNALEAVEKGINNAELDPTNTSVGYGGYPNQSGEVTLDAVLMWGPTHKAGGVGCIKRIKTPISVARRVLEKTTHTFLVGEDATRFALAEGFREENLLTANAKRAWKKWKANPKRKDFRNHDTIGMVAIDKNGDISAGCSTSGLAWKIPGRVGDSPIIGSGTYCDNKVGGAAATGNGDVMMRFCPTFLAVELMREGASPTEACIRSLDRILKKGVKPSACLVAVNKKGEFGAAKIGRSGFPYAVRNTDVDEVRESR
jgi:isoaspartyl peptidase/L-asparaginase-like protein (Ntn-hydrolase superfamily)